MIHDGNISLKAQQVWDSVIMKNKLGKKGRFIAPKTWENTSHPILPLKRKARRENYKRIQEEIAEYIPILESQKQYDSAVNLEMATTTSIWQNIKKGFLRRCTRSLIAMMGVILLWTGIDIAWLKLVARADIDWFILA